ncbi:phosphatidate cytidylyltransferase [Leptolyngbya sp. 7M]|uniref:phosphatidate cytidylyltransferase n=1 Tax=Leptolyngbya sp. 7M TaxID=2812896 RepID=UPI001B8BDF58|nr:phosphatidate cytidylyltransferase [Leptolyngbya sp. 7M]QYO65985.1 phosphatidate cytidylyltransferase [Leptolyngbya sp. 7M]
MKTRLLTAAVALPILLGSIILPLWIPESIWLFVFIAVLAIAAGLFEFYSLTKKLELKADASVGYLGATALLVAFIFDAPSKAPDLLMIAMALFIAAVLVTQTFRFQKDFTKMLTGIGVTILGVFYLSFLGGFLIATRVGFEHAPGVSSKLLLFFLVVLFGSDSGAYFSGKAFGKHKLAPN